MAAADEFRDPWGWLLAGVSGGLGWAVLGSAPIAIPAGLAIAAGVLGTKVAVGAITNRERTPDPGRLPPPPPGSAQHQLLQRADAAQRRIRALADSPADEWVAGHIGSFDDDTRIVAARLAELAGRVTVVDNSLTAARPDVLAVDRRRFAAEAAATTDPGLRAERDRLVRAVDDQIASVNRLTVLRERLLGRMSTAVLGLEGIAARMGELVALGSDPVSHDRAGEVLGDLTGELDTLRSGLSEAESLGQQIGGFNPRAAGSGNPPPAPSR